MKKLLAVTACAAVIGMAGIAAATPVELVENGNFETGDLTGWQTSGDVQVSYAGPLASMQGMDDYYALLGKRITDGKSTLRQDVDLAGYDLTSVTISFDWAFGYWDNSRSAEDTFISFIRQDDKPALKITMLDLQTSGTGFWNPDFGVAYGTFTKTYNLIDDYGYVSEGIRTVFRLSEESDDCCFTGTASLAGIDNVSIKASVSPVPEPTTMLLFGTGLAGLAGVARRKRK